MEGNREEGRKKRERERRQRNSLFWRVGKEEEFLLELKTSLRNSNRLPFENLTKENKRF